MAIVVVLVVLVAIAGSVIIIIIAAVVLAKLLTALGPLGSPSIAFGSGACAVERRSYGPAGLINPD